jgi:hypothetical protein
MSNPNPIIPPDGPPKRKAGRPKGAHNKTAMSLKEAILSAANSYDENGRSGMAGWLEELRDRFPKAFATLLGRVLPLQVTTMTPDGKDAPLRLSVEIIKPDAAD